jgi:hypothetical protein
MADKYINTIDDFMKEHPELDTSLKPVIDPVFKESEDRLFNFIMSYIFM